MSAAPKTSDKSKQQASTSEEGFTAEERSAMKQRAAELRAAKRRGSAAEKAAAEARDVLAKIAELPESDRAMAERLHRIITAAVPDLAPKLWYGMPAYAKDGKMLCFFQSSEKFKTRYAELGFSDHAKLDDGAFWPVAYAVTELGEAEEAQITALVKKAAG
ncbi:MAG TPA: DUF1801 domain-containing protein [Propionibacteriaceae bacterium]|jgi:uncharacterized protein YdhG (YjbR/CyaY superfamily)|nr:DUF1801 domain-containing protein [Propionibacteriaceae bacterium]